MGSEKIQARAWEPAVPAVGRLAMSDDAFWQEYMLGCIPFALVNGMLLLHYWQSLVLPVHSEPDALRHILPLALVRGVGQRAAGEACNVPAGTLWQCLQTH